jgi:DNA adenine methylase
MSLTSAVRDTDIAKQYSAARPFLKWAGGKRQLLPQLRRFVPEQFSSYFEPFLGSGAVFFNLASRAAMGNRDVWLSDTNRDLLGTYCALMTDVDAVISELKRHATLHQRAPREHYYRVRDKQFNPQRQRLFATAIAAPIESYSPALAAMFIYLNRTGFNGLFRLNAAGGFNVPAGRYANPQICDEANLRAVAHLLRGAHVRVKYDSFESVLDQSRSGDFVYFDPPYAPLSATANFTGYTASGFTDDDQRRLQRVAIDLAQRGCHVTISNSTAPIIKDLYDKNRDARRAGFAAHTVAARRAINSNASLRGEIAEYIITNVQPGY